MTQFNNTATSSKPFRLVTLLKDKQKMTATLQILIRLQNTKLIIGAITLFSHQRPDRTRVSDTAIYKKFPIYTT